MITKKAWFGPMKGVGWGWSPVSREGWAVIAVFIAITLGAHFIFGVPGAMLVTLGVLPVLILVCCLTGCKPG